MRARSRLSALAALVILLPTGVGRIQEGWGAHRSLTAAEAADDLEELADLLESYHPRLYRFQSARDWKALVARARATITGPMPLVDFYRLTWSVVAAVRDGHTRVSGADVLDIGALPVLPLDVEWTGSEALIERTFAPASAQLVGAEILALDGEPIASVMSVVSDRIYSDGGSTVGKRAAINAGGWSRWVALLHSAPRERRIRVAWPDGRRADESVAAIPLADYWPQAAPERRHIVRIHETGEDAGIAYVAFDDFEDPDPHTSFRDWASELFGRLERAGTRVLILDLRANGGGPTRNGVELASHLLPEPFEYTHGIDTRTAEIPRFELTGLPAEYADDFAGSIGQPLGGGLLEFRDLTHSFGVGPQRPQRPTFAGELIVLIGGLTFSTASDLVSVLDRHRHLTLLGEETGGAADGNASGVIPSFPLRHSGIRVQLPLLQFHTGQVREGSVGVPPDEAIVPSADERRAGRDPVLDRAYACARRLVPMKTLRPVVRPVAAAETVRQSGGER